MRRIVEFEDEPGSVDLVVASLRAMIEDDLADIVMAARGKMTMPV
jgi:hypothetical protein